MRESIHFTYNGTSSEDMGVFIVSPSGGLYQEPFLPTRKIIETSVSQKKPYFMGVDVEPLSFSFYIFINEWDERDNLRQIARWLTQDYYKPLWFNDKPQHIYYAIIEGTSTLTHNGAKNGYIEINVRCDSPYSYSPLMTETVSSSDINYTILNEGDLNIKPRVRIKKTVSNGDIQIKNTTLNQTIIFKEIQKDEEIFVDFEHEEIVSSLQYLNIYRYENHNDVWLEFIGFGEDLVGENNLEFIGDFEIEFEYEFIYLAEQ